MPRADNRCSNSNCRRWNIQPGPDGLTLCGRCRDAAKKKAVDPQAYRVSSRLSRHTEAEFEALAQRAAEKKPIIAERRPAERFRRLEVGCHRSHS